MFFIVITSDINIYLLNMEKIAVVGSGISGLGTALLLQQQHEVHLFESDNRLGGHACTYQINSNSLRANVDMGFLVYNELTYPHLTAMFKFLDVETFESDMSLSIQVPRNNLEWSGDNLDTVFAQRNNLLSPSFYKMVYDIIKFHKDAEKNRDLSRINKWSVGDLLSAKKYSRQLAEWYILPMIAAIWSTPEKNMLDFPAETFLTFFINHKLLQVNDRPMWRTVKNGSKQYVDKIAQRLKHIHLSEAAISAVTTEQGIKLTTHKAIYDFDKIVFATHVPVTRKILKTENQKILNVLKHFETQKNKAFLHQDQTHMPQRKKCWAAWNVKAQMSDNQLNDKVSLTYYLNRLQNIISEKPVLLTLNPTENPVDTITSAEFDHPHFNQNAIDAQKQIDLIQGLDNVYFAGAWTRYGFHEDGLLSAVNVAKKFDIATPWKVS